MKSDYEVIVFSDDWEGVPFSCKHLMKHFLPEVPILWVETIGLRSPQLNIYDIKRVFGKLYEWFFSSKNDGPKLPENLTIINPFQIPYNHFRLVRKINKKKIIDSINRHHQGRSARYRIVLTTWPFLGEVFGNLNEDLTIYYRVDDFSEFPGVRKDFISQLEQEMMDKVDMIVASSEHLSEIEGNEKKSKYLPHGVDFEHFSSGKSSNIIYKQIECIPGPRIGFFGLLNSWLNFDLIQEVALAHSEWSFIMIGPSQLPSSALPSAPNIHYLGPVHYSKLPSYARYFDVALVPFKINKLTMAVNPLKLMEYFALGLPVVSTPLPEVVKYEGKAYIAADAQSFEEAIHKALNEDDHDLKTERENLAESNSWKSKSADLRHWIEEELNQKVKDKQ